MTLHLLAFQPDLPALMRLASRERLLPPGDDPGYAIHAVLAATFGDLAPEPWVLLPPRGGGGPAGRLLAYSRHPLDALRSHADTFADPAFAAPLALPAVAARPMTTDFSAGTRLGFRVRVRPVSRQGRPVPGHSSAEVRGARGRERDVFVARREFAARQALAVGPDTSTSQATPDGPPAPPISRAACYLDWLDARLRAAGAVLARVADPTSLRSAADRTLDDGAVAARVDAYRTTRLLARDRSSDRSRTTSVDGPDVVITGTLLVFDTEAFAAALTRGIGRHRAFGFGMLLLTPPRG